MFVDIVHYFVDHPRIRRERAWYVFTEATRTGAVVNCNVDEGVAANISSVVCTS